MRVRVFIGVSVHEYFVRPKIDDILDLNTKIKEKLKGGVHRKQGWIEKGVLEEDKCVLESESVKYFGIKFECYGVKYLGT